MPDAPLAAPAPSPFAVEFNAYVAGDYNRDLGGKGTLAIRPDEPRFVFTGRPRRTIFFGKVPVELTLRSDQIWNVTQHDDGVAFSTTVGKSGAKHQPFVFTCASAADATTIVAQLPTTQDAGFREDTAFAEKLRALPSRSSGLGSATNLLILANVAVFIVMGILGAGWLEVADRRPIITYGANHPGLTIALGQWWRLATSLFLHFGLLHLFLNQWALLDAGHLFERLVGRSLFLAVYLTSGIVGSLSSLLWHKPPVLSAGASGAVFGIYGALLGYLLRERASVPAGVFKPLFRSLLIFVGYNLLFGAVVPHIDNAAHAGGLLGGLVLGWLSALPLDPADRTRLRRRRLVTTSACAAVVIATGIALASRHR